MNLGLGLSGLQVRTTLQLGNYLGMSDLDPKSLCSSTAAQKSQGRDQGPLAEASAQVIHQIHCC